MLYTNGEAMACRYIKDRSARCGEIAIFNAEQIRSVEAMLTAEALQSGLISGEKHPHEKITCFIFFDATRQSQLLFTGGLPKQLQDMVDFIKTEVRIRQKSIYVAENQ